MKLRGRQSRRIGAGLAAAALAVGMAACGSVDADSANGSTAVVAQAGTQVNYIFPFYGPQYATVQNVQQFQRLMYRPLYWFGKGADPVLNEDLSLADPPVWSNGNRVAKVHLKDFRWSNGEKLTPKNVAFWLGLARTEKKNWAYYTAGSIPDDLASVAYDDAANTVTFTLNKAVAPDGFLNAELGQITPFPIAWDVTGSGTKGSCASEDTAAQATSCPAVYDYLSGQAKDQSTYTSSPLWSVVNGPFTLASYQRGTQYTFKPNTKYSGPVKAKLAALTFKFFQSDAAEYNALLSKSVDVGYIPTSNLKPKAPGSPTGPSPVPGYQLDPVPFLAYFSVQMNYNNPDAGPLFRQLYIRQALQLVVNQDLAVQKANQGYGFAQYGPIPQQPVTPYVSKATTSNPYPFDVDRAKHLLQSHGWSVAGSGTATCDNPGTGPAQCGAGIPKGKALEFKLEETAGNTRVEQIMQQFASDASGAGITIHLAKETGNQVVGNLIACKPDEATCGWQMINAGANGYSSPFPSGKDYFGTGASQNFGSYSDPRMDQLIDATLTSSDRGAMADYERYAAEQVPSIWQPSFPLQVAAVSDRVKGAAPLNRALTPEYWSLS
ncbi:ABC transporter substrate-binding protein [Labedaea rhizosphaerae]|uniref:Peptide/nickel transport system substrate-binding protein n=1 Tax=Labedaea rhizosphaerae TaxID=598644 RepID=A0A4R6SFS2_LABRH|nr:ABC transporter substrate-binding protein [Labedaea rhizosphaerae]TDQ00533.1 peptide/nickel transport system substrate-binding protein [Labedaea rhizosphaerae]